MVDRYIYSIKPEAEHWYVLLSAVTYVIWVTVLYHFPLSIV